MLIPIEETIQAAKNQTNWARSPSPVVEEINVPANDVMDLSLILVSMVENVVEEITDPGTEAVALMEQSNIPIAEIEDIFNETSTYDF